MVGLEEVDYLCEYESWNEFGSYLYLRRWKFNIYIWEGR